MAQVFKPYHNTLARTSLLCVVVLPGVLLVLLSSITRSSYNTKVNVPLDQPVPFSHQHHVAELGLDCRYCHTSVEKSGFAGIPPTETCMTCHSQIWTNSPLLEPIRESYRTGTPVQWNRVNKVPDFVYFNHSIHINRGIVCNVCHGPVQKQHITAKGQPFHMSWCLDCHRNPEKYVRPGGAQGVFEVYAKYQAGQKAIKESKLISDKGLTPEEYTLMQGQTYHRTPQELEEGSQLLEQLKVKKKQLADCWICHR